LFLPLIGIITKLFSMYRKMMIWIISHTIGNGKTQPMCKPIKCFTIVLDGLNLIIMTQRGNRGDTSMFLPISSSNTRATSTTATFCPMRIMRWWDLSCSSSPVTTSSTPILHAPMVKIRSLYWNGKIGMSASINYAKINDYHKT
jgi:hypothetical protein